LRAHDFEGSRIGALNCWENWMPLELPERDFIHDGGPAIPGPHGRWPTTAESA
jgi:hypothetical protein